MPSSSTCPGSALDLPKVSSNVNALEPDKIEFSIDAAGVLHWNGEVETRADVRQRFVAGSSKQPQPQLQLRADQSVAYRCVAQTLADACKAGLSKVGFVSEPEPAP